MSTETKKNNRRMDKALTQSIASAMIQRVKSGSPLISRDYDYLLIDYEMGQKPISKWTYNSWMKRGTIPLDSKNNIPIRIILDEERLKYKEEKEDRLLDLSYSAIERILGVDPVQKKVIECTNEDTKMKEKIVIEEINPNILREQLKAVKVILNKEWAQ